MRRAWLLLFTLFPSLALAQGAVAVGPNVAELQRLFAKPPEDSRILMR